MAGYAVYFNLSLVDVVILFLFGFIPFMLSAGSLGVIILFIMIKLAVKVGLRKIVYTVGSAYVLALLLFFRMNSPVELVNSVMKYYPIIDKDQYLGNLIPSLIKILPNNWMAELSFWILKNDFVNALPLIIAQCILSITLFSIALTLGKKWYFKTWLNNVQLISDYSLNRKNKFSFFNFDRKSYLNILTETFFKRDFFMFVREPSQVIHFSVLIFLIFLFMLSVAGIHYIGLGNIFLQTGIFLAVLLFNLLLISTLSLRFIFPLISLEGETFWLIKAAPVRSESLIQKKYQLFGTIILVISLGLSYFSFYRFEFIIELNTLLVTLISAITIITINLGMGGLFSNFKEKNAIRLSSSQGASIAFLINIFYMLLIVSFLFIPMNNYFLSKMIGGGFNYYTLFNFTTPLFFISAILIHLFYKAGKKSLEKDF
jgi:ABC-2 type transport system permease protein